ncbi:conjugal transfer protein TraD [Candidatus Neptunichlamydia sp. REUL1]|uniref:conjugal transfer protein TraD n=1 Tax=Candidatus Neptunichlamydia sp. REUL1 TaxID=3064277 RepID=UPI0029316BC2|nr:conjugal transfer protein TraD [Candidatus Neptunochlamydia sp. REUL1]
MNELEKKKEALKLKKSRIEHQERLLKLKERKNRTRLLIEVGGVASKAGIDHLNTNTLLGAFLEIKEKEKEEGTLKRWTKKGAEALDRDKKKNGEPLIVTFAEEPEKKIKTEIRQAGLRWNRFRKEWQGFAKKVQLEKLLKGVDHQVQAVGSQSSKSVEEE